MVGVWSAGASAMCEIPLQASAAEEVTGQGHPGTVRTRQDNRSDMAEMPPEKPWAGAGPIPCRFTSVQEAGGVC